MKCGKQATVVVTITAAGDTLKPMVVFKGARNCHMVKCQFPSYIVCSLYACQENSWMDEACMLQWVNDILKPNFQTAYLRIIPALLLDLYRCHMMSSIVEAINDLGVHVEYIPACCTGLCQPVDVGFNKPFNGRMHSVGGVDDRKWAK